MTADDFQYRYRLRALALTEGLGNVRAACRALGIHHSTFYRWRRIARRHGLELLRPRERRGPAMPNQTSPMIEQRVLAYSLAHPGHGGGPRRQRGGDSPPARATVGTRPGRRAAWGVSVIDELAARRSSKRQPAPGGENTSVA